MSGKTERARIALGGREIAYTLKRSNRRTIGFRINADGLSVTAPRLAPRRVVEDALREKSRWILAKLTEWENRPARRALAWESGDLLPVLGEDHELDIIERGVRTTVKREPGRLLVTVDPEAEGALRTRAIRSGLERWARREALSVMEPMVRRHAAALGRKAGKVTVREQKSRWGSCSSDGSIRLNWRLIGFPEPLVDYVCAHEAAHLSVPNHSAAFWAEVDRLTPDWKALRKQMRDETERWVWP